MLPLIYLLENGGKYIQYVKFGCELAGIPVGPVRPPMGGLTAEEKDEFRQPLRGPEGCPDRRLSTAPSRQPVRQIGQRRDLR